MGKDLVDIQGYRSAIGAGDHAHWVMFEETLLGRRISQTMLQFVVVAYDFAQATWYIAGWFSHMREGRFLLEKLRRKGKAAKLLRLKEV